MATNLDRVLVERLVSGLRRSAVKTPSKWAETYRKVKDGPWTFKHFPWLREMHDSTAFKNVGQKSAQMGFTETLLNLTFYAIDIRGLDCLYVLPNKNPDASDFSSGRFAPALALSPHLQNLFTDTDNVGHKRAGAANLYIRGSQSRAGLKSLPINYLLMDEVAEFVEENIPLAFARTDGQLEKRIWMVSTPTIDGHGIGKYWDDSDKRHFFFKCPSCSRRIELKFPYDFHNITFTFSISTGWRCCYTESRTVGYDSDEGNGQHRQSVIITPGDQRVDLAFFVN